MVGCAVLYISNISAIMHDISEVGGMHLVTTCVYRLLVSCRARGVAFVVTAGKDDNIVLKSDNVHKHDTD